MRRKVFAVLAMFALLWSVAGCGDDPYRYTFQAYSDRSADGDVAFDGFTTQANVTGSVMFGVDPVTGDEYRGFLTLPLDGSTDGDVLPLSATIETADVGVYVETFAGSSRVTVRADLVEYDPDGLVPDDFDGLFVYATQTFLLDPDNEGDLVRIDMTPLLQEAQSRGFSLAQIRFSFEYPLADEGLVTLYDGSLYSRAPLLTIEYE